MMKKLICFSIIILFFASLWIIPSFSNAVKGDFNNDGSININDAIFGLQV
ncbi:secreted protein, partial [Candidatus Magnetomorum sp. HK-1]